MTEATALVKQFPPDLSADIILGDSIFGNISFNGLQACGVLRSYAPNLTGVASDSLYQITGLDIEHSPALQTLTFPNLTGESDPISLYLTALPLLTKFEFNARLTLPWVVGINGTGLKSFNASLPASSYSGFDYNFDFSIKQNKDMSQIYLGLERIRS